MFYSRIEYEWQDDGTLRIARAVEFAYRGPVAECKGASQQMNNISAQQEAFYATMRAQEQQRFAGQNAILDTLKHAWQPILDKGPNQRGFSDEERAVYRTQATEGTGAEYKKAVEAFGEGRAAAGGGNEYLPTGTDAQIRGALAGAAASDQATKNLAIEQADYGLGRDMYSRASSVLGSTAGIYDPTGFAGNANNAGANAFSSANKIQEMNNAGSIWNAVGGILGGGLSAFAGGFGGGLGKKLGGG